MVNVCGNALSYLEVYARMVCYFVGLQSGCELLQRVATSPQAQGQTQGRGATYLKECHKSQVSGQKLFVKRPASFDLRPSSMAEAPKNRVRPQTSAVWAPLLAMSP